MRSVLRRRLPVSLLIMAVLSALWVAAGGVAAAAPGGKLPGVVPAGSDGNSPRYPVDYNFLSGIPDELAHPGGSLPGTNDWSCRPSAAHPDPVVLVHGTAGGAQTNWGSFAPLLADAGYCVYALNYGALNLPWPVSALGGMGRIEDSGAQLAAFVRRVRTTTGAAKVDLVAHSQGNLVANYFVKRLGGSAEVDRFVAIAAPWLGTFNPITDPIRAFVRPLGAEPAFDQLLNLGFCQACSEMQGTSPFIRSLNADGVYDPHVIYTNIESRDDELIVPYTNGVVPGPHTTNILVQDGCPADFSTHTSLVASARAGAFMLNALDPAHPRPVPCHFIAPFVGG